MSPLALPDGRTLEIEVTGPEGGAVVVFHHGTPGACLPIPAVVAAASERGLRVVRYSRPGYGGSTPQPGRPVASVAGDVTAIADHVGAGEILTYWLAGMGD